MLGRLTISLDRGHEPAVAVEFEVAQVRVGASINHQFIHHLQVSGTGYLYLP